MFSFVKSVTTCYIQLYRQAQLWSECTQLGLHGHRRNLRWRGLTWGRYRSPSFSSSLPSQSVRPIVPPAFHPSPSILLFASPLKFSKEVWSAFHIAHCRRLAWSTNTPFYQYQPPHGTARKTVNSASVVTTLWRYTNLFVIIIIIIIINSRQPSLCGCGSTHLEYTAN